MCAGVRACTLCGRKCVRYVGVHVHGCTRACTHASMHECLFAWVHAHIQFGAINTSRVRTTYGPYTLFFFFGGGGAHLAKELGLQR